MTRAIQRYPTKLSPSTDQKLESYMLAAQGTPASSQLKFSSHGLALRAAGASVLALALPTEGKIVYTPTHQIVSYGQKYAYLDLNKDGINDFELGDYFAGGSGSTAGIRAYQFPRNGANRIMGKGVYPFALSGGRVIGPKKQFSRHAYRMASRIQNDSRTYFRGLWAKDGTGVKNHYLGLKFAIHGKVHYGWARVTMKFMDGRKPVATLTGYAYETIPGKPIIAGATKGPEEQAGSLGALAAGAVGR